MDKTFVKYVPIKDKSMKDYMEHKLGNNFNFNISLIIQIIN